MPATFREMGVQIESVLVVDDDELTLSAFRTSLPRRGIAVHTASSRAAALALARTHHPQVAFVDLQLGFDNGLDLLGELTRELPKMRTFLMTGYGSVRTAVTAMRLGAVDVLTKPFTVDELVKQLDPEYEPAAGERVKTPTV